MLKILIIIQWVAVSLFLSACNIDQSTPLPNHFNQSSQFVQVKNGQLEYYQFGQGPPIVMIEGYAVDVSGWSRSFLTELAKNHKVIVFNNRAVGRSYVKSKEYTSVDLADDTYQLIQKLRLKKPTILGISMGGMIAQQLAVRHPNQLGPIILINTAIAGKQSVRPNAEIKKEMFTLPSTQLERFLLAIKLFFPPSASVKMGYALITDRFQPNQYKPIDAKTILPIQQKLLLKWGDDNQTAEQLRHLKLPVLILNGEADIAIPPINSIILARNIPHARLIRWKDGGHGMIYQYPKQIALIIDQFIMENR